MPETLASGRRPISSRLRRSSSTATADSSPLKEHQPSLCKRFWFRSKRPVRKRTQQKKLGRRKKPDEKDRPKRPRRPEQAPLPSRPQNSLTPIPNAAFTTKAE